MFHHVQREFIHLLINKYLLNAYYVPGIDLGFGNTVVNKTYAIPVFTVLIS